MGKTPGPKESDAAKTFKRMTTASVPGLVVRLAVPTILSSLVTALYNTASTYYVSYLGTSAVGAMGVVFALQTIIQAVGFMMGQGCAAQTSRLLGAKEYEKANRLASSGIFGVLVLASILAVLGLIFIEPLMRIMGATPTILPYAKAYAEVVLLAAPFMAASFSLNNLLRSEGMALLGMIGLGTGGILNIAVSPLFIFTFDLGIAGAAWATGLCQTLSFAILITCLWKGIGSLRFRPAFIARTPKLYLSIVQTGMPSLTRNSFGAIAASVLNLAAGQFGDVGVAAMSIVGRVIMITNAGMIGLGQGYQPVLGYNWGAKLYRRVRTALVSVLSMATALMTVLGVLGFIFAPEIIGFFETNDPLVLEIGVEALRYQCIISPLIPVNVIGNMSYQVLGRAAIGTFLASTRQGICFLPMILLLPPLLGIRGVELAQPAAETLAFFICGFFVVHFYREIRSLIADPGAQRTLPLHGSGKSN